MNDPIGRYTMDAVLGKEDPRGSPSNRFLRQTAGDDCEVTVNIKLFRQTEVAFSEGLKRIADALESAGLAR